MTPASIVSIAGSDSFAGAGIQADLKTAQALGVYCATAITAVTAQNSRGVYEVAPIPADVITGQLRAIDDDLAPGAIKIGMVGSAAVIDLVAAYLVKRDNTVPVVLDTVIRATSGGQLLDPDAHRAMVKQLLPLAAVITPNAIEAGILLETEPARNEAQLAEQARALTELGTPAALVKGGHLNGDQSVDALYADGEIQFFRAPRIETHHTHGTGCSLSTAIAAGLAQGQTLSDAVQTAKEFVSGAIASAQSWELVKQNGPLDHGWMQRN